MDQIGLGVELMGYGLAGVFSFLIIFFFLIKALLYLFPEKSGQKEDEKNS